MKTANKVFLAGMIGVVLALGLVLASCKQVYEGTDDYYGLGKTVTLTLKSKSYEIQYDGLTYSGSATKTRTKALGIKLDTYVFTSGGTGGAVVLNKELADLTYTNGTIVINSSDMSKRSVTDGGISLNDIELIIIEDEE